MMSSFRETTSSAGWTIHTIIWVSTWLLFFLMLPVSLQAQNIGSVSGTVFDSETDETVPGAHVYLANTTIGDISQANGFFQIQDIKAGDYLLIVTIIGYKPFEVPVEIKPDKTADLSIKLEKEIYEVGEITVTDNKPKTWKRDLTRFKRQFLGNTENRRGCEIENPFVISFEKEKRQFNHFAATASEPLTIVNKSLGYKITYYLRTFSTTGAQFRFTGFPTFEELAPKNDKEARKWKKQRARAYEGSFQHFLRSLAAGTLQEDGFRIFLINQYIWDIPHKELFDLLLENRADRTAGDVLREQPIPYERILQFPGYLHVFYLNQTMHRDYYEDAQTTYNASKEPIRAALRLLQSDATFNEIGFLNNTFDLTRYGYWQWESGICNWLPFNYGLEPAE